VGVDKMKEFKLMAQQKRYLEEMGYNVIGIGLYGSQNYNMSYEKSDIDLRAVVMPTLEQIITRAKISKKYITEYGDIDVKDLLTYYEVVRKGNFSFIEPFQSKWYIGDKYLKELFGNIELNLKSVKGAMLERAKAFRHKYPSKEYETNKWGYDPKQLHHIIRLLDLLKLNDSSKSYIYYKDDDIMKKHLMAIKRNTGNCIDSLTYIDITSFETLKKHINGQIFEYELIPSDYKYEQVDLSKEITKYIKDNIKLDIKNTPTMSARQYRTFGQQIPKKDVQRFPELKQYQGQDISYIVYEELEIL
jgi:hypothetical protein